MNTILKSFLFNFLPPGPLYLICGIFEKTTHLDMQRADDLSKWLQKKRRGGGMCAENCFANCTDNRLKRKIICLFFSVHVYTVADGGRQLCLHVIHLKNEGHQYLSK